MDEGWRLACLLGFEIVDYLRHGRAAELLRRIGTQFGHHLLYLPGSGYALADHGDETFLAVAVFLVDLLEQLVHGQSLVGGPCGALCDHHGADLGVLVAHELPDVEAVALLASADELARGLVPLDDFRYILESCQNIVYGYAETLADVRYELGRDYGLDHILALAEGAELLAAAQDVVCEHRGRLVAVHQHHLPLVVAHRDSETVGVGVGSHYEVRPGLLRLFEREPEGCGLFGIRRHDGGEVAVGDILLGHMYYVLESEPAEYLGHEPDSAAVQGSVDYLEVGVPAAGVGAETQREKVPDIALVHLAAHCLYFSAAQAGAELDHGRVGNLRDLCDYLLVYGRGHLPSVGPADLVAVVFLGIV